MTGPTTIGFGTPAAAADPGNARVSASTRSASHPSRILLGAASRLALNRRSTDILTSSERRNGRNVSPRTARDFDDDTKNASRVAQGANSTRRWTHGDIRNWHR